jgi:hypothetical protein
VDLIDGYASVELVHPVDIFGALLFGGAGANQSINYGM